MKSKKLRKLIYGIELKIPVENGEKVQAINFDNAATTPSLVSVVRDVIHYLLYYSSVHRGYGFKSTVSTKLYDKCRESVSKFVGGDINKDSVIFTKNTTEAINKLSNTFFERYKDCVVLSTFMEHHSNDLPWRKFNIAYVEVDEEGILDLQDLENKLIYFEGRVKLITVTGASNVTGYVNPIYKIASLAHKYNAKILVDGAQFIPHCPIDMKGFNDNDYIDFLAFSGHKMYAPFGTGVLIGPKEFFQEVKPDYSGGGTIEIVTHDYIKWADTPLKDEPGSPNLVGAVALTSAIDALQSIGMKEIEKYELALTKYAIKELKKLPNIKLYCNSDNSIENHIGIVSFNVKGIYHEEVARFLSEKKGIAVRSGCFCAHPYVQKLLKISDEEIKGRIEGKDIKPGMVRLSFGFYNNYQEIDEFIKCMKELIVTLC